VILASRLGSDASPPPCFDAELFSKHLYDDRSAVGSNAVAAANGVPRVRQQSFHRKEASCRRNSDNSLPWPGKRRDARQRSTLAQDSVKCEVFNAVVNVPPGINRESPYRTMATLHRSASVVSFNALSAGATSVFTAATKPFRLRADTASRENALAGKSSRCRGQARPVE